MDRPGHEHQVEIPVESVLHAPSVRHDLFSVSAACDIGGFKALFSKTKVEFFDEDETDLSPKNAIFTGLRKGSMWVFTI